MTEEKPLQPLSNGNVLLVGVKASNLDEELKTHPRVVIWDSQRENWTGRDLPYNVRAVFMTRFVSHNTSTRILAEARKRQILVFNPEGTGMITRQVKELLAIHSFEATLPTTLTEVEEMSRFTPGKLKPLYPFIDFSKGNTENAKFLLEKAKELKIDTTFISLTQLMVVQRRKQNQTGVPKSIQPKVDVSVEILDNMIKELTDMRQFLIDTVEENRVLKGRMDSLKKMFEV